MYCISREKLVVGKAGHLVGCLHSRRIIHIRKIPPSPLWAMSATTKGGGLISIVSGSNQTKGFAKVSNLLPC